MSGQIKRISRARFDALSFSRQPLANFFLERVEWYADKNEIVIATLVKDKIDNDWGFIILGRDENGLFRAIDTGVSLENIPKTRDALRKSIRKHVASGKTTFTQGDFRKKRNKIYEKVAADDKLHPFFVKLIDEPVFSPAKEIIQEIIYAYEDPDGNYIEQFQTSGFNSRLWELYLFAYLHEEDFMIERSFPFPDYMCRKFKKDVFIEAVTVNPSGNKGLIEEEPETVEEILQKLKDYMPIKFGSTLFSKLSKKYWQHEHVKGHPLIFAIQDFHQDRSMLWSSMALPTYLYGVQHHWHYDDSGNLIITPEYVEKHEYGTKQIPSGFFFQPDAENVSAVLFSNSATISKFNRMGKLAGFGDPKLRMVRIGVCHDHDPNSAIPVQFEFQIDPKKHDETWAEGLSMYHNPRALHPVDPNLFPSIAHHSFKDGQIISHLPEFFPYVSVTMLIYPKERSD